MTTIKITLPAGETVFDGKIISFRAPCDCEGTAVILIGEREFWLVRGAGASAVKKHTFRAGSWVTVILDCQDDVASVSNGQNVFQADEAAYAEEATKANYLYSDSSNLIEINDDGKALVGQGIYVVDVYCDSDTDIWTATITINELGTDVKALVKPATDNTSAIYLRYKPGTMTLSATDGSNAFRLKSVRQIAMIPLGD